MIIKHNLIFCKINHRKRKMKQTKTKYNFVHIKLYVRLITKSTDISI